MKSRVLVTGWFSFEQMGASAGDLLARDVVCDWLLEVEREFDIATAPPFTDGLDWRTADPASYSHIIFVCGPFGNGPPVVEFLEHFASCKLVGVNLTMLQPLEEWNPFELLLERDSSRTARPDLVFLSQAAKAPVVGLIQIDTQPEYAGSQLHDAHAIIERFIASREMAVVRVDTRLDENKTGLRTAGEVESLIARMDLVITTRLHGTVLALKNGVPAIAVDSVAGGAKITRQVKALGWQIIFGVKELTEAKLANAFDYCLTPQARAEAIACRDNAVSLLLAAREDFLSHMSVDSLE